MAIVEIGGTVGDIESLPFLEAARQMSLRMGRNNAAFVHLTLVPYIASAGELKTKLTQHSVQKLREIGIYPNVLLCRADRRIPDDERAKISMFPNVPLDAVISVWDVDSIYKIPAMLHKAGRGQHRVRGPGPDPPPADLSMWDNLVDALEHPQDSVTIGMVGKYVDLTESYKSLSEALVHAGIHTPPRSISSTSTPRISETRGTDQLKHLDAILVPGGFRQARHRGQDRCHPLCARERRAVPGHLPGHAAGRDRVRAPRGRPGRRQQHRVRSGRAASGGGPDHRMDGSRRPRRAPRQQLGSRRHHAQGRAALSDPPGHPGAVHLRRRRQRAPSPPLRSQQRVCPRLEDAGMVISARTPTENLPEMMELPSHPWFVGVQFHPEFTSTPRDGHPLFSSYIRAALEHKAQRAKEA